MTTKIKITPELTCELSLHGENQLQILVNECAKLVAETSKILRAETSHSDIVSYFDQALVGYLPKKVLDERTQVVDPYGLRQRELVTDEQEPAESDAASSWEELDRYLPPWISPELSGANELSLGQTIGLELAELLARSKPNARHSLYQTSIAQMHTLFMNLLGITAFNPRDQRTGAAEFAHQVVRQRLLTTAPSTHFVTEPIRGYRNDRKTLEKIKARDRLDPDKELEFYQLLPNAGRTIVIKNLNNQGVSLGDMREIADRVANKFQSTIDDLKALSQEVLEEAILTEGPSPTSF